MEDNHDHAQEMLEILVEEKIQFWDGVGRTGAVPAHAVKQVKAVTTAVAANETKTGSSVSTYGSMYEDEFGPWGGVHGQYAGKGTTSYSSTYAGHYVSGPRCYESHKPLPLKDGMEIYGGSCSSPIVTDADVYVGLDSGMKLTSRSWPWTPGTEIYYPIQDMTAPSDPASFKKLVDFICEQLKAGLKVHVGCIGGHGRTGTLLAAVVAVLMGEKDAIQYVRKHYCSKAVETGSQVKFLVEHFGVSPAEAAKSYGGLTSGGSKGSKTVTAMVQDGFTIWGRWAHK